MGYSIIITTPDGKQFDEYINSAVLPTICGKITILSNHEPIIGVILNGETKIHDAKNSIVNFKNASGIYNFTGEKLYIFTNFFEFK
ncbi:MAG: hypothetical protein LBD05_02010 [Mycoplasmataceae bacterium]|jgi:F0F1-type ATP synthase epsilon subunit|nr:hypothetical protein [Mycoplasmataceae bacterium]